MLVISSRRQVHFISKWSGCSYWTKSEREWNKTSLYFSSDQCISWMVSASVVVVATAASTVDGGAGILLGVADVDGYRWHNKI